MATWKSKICRGMDVVETITFIRQDVDSNGNVILASAVHIPGGGQENRVREEWTQEEIDAIGETIVAQLDAELEHRKTNQITLPEGV